MLFLEVDTLVIKVACAVVTEVEFELDVVVMVVCVSHDYELVVVRCAVHDRVNWLVRVRDRGKMHSITSAPCNYRIL